MVKKILLSVFVLALLGVVIKRFYFSRHNIERSKLNVLLITLDTMRADRLGFYGYDNPTSPNLDKLAEESVVFDNAIAQASITPVSHASILTGLEPYRHGLRVLHGLIANRLEDKFTTLAEVWKEAGGKTAAFISAFPATKVFGLNQGFDHFDANFPLSDSGGVISQNGIVFTGKSQRRAKETTDSVISWLRAQLHHRQPLFMWVHYFDPHDTLVLPPGEVVKKLMDYKFRPVSQKKGDVLRSLYDCEVHYMDDQIGNLLNEFKKQGLWDKTVVVIVADHGEGLGDHDWWAHGLLYQEQIRVPLLIRIPGIKGGSRINSIVRTIDLMPTILAAAEINTKLWPYMDGISLINAMRMGHTNEPLIAYSESVNMLTYGRPDNEGLHIKDDKLYCLIKGTHKFIYHQLQPKKSEYYNLSEDPKELNNLAAQQPKEMSSMFQSLNGLNALSGIMPGMTPTDLERLRHLKSLGYIQ